MTKLVFQVRPDGQGPFQCALEVTSEYVEVTTMMEERRPNLAWEFVDHAGHYHAWAKDETLPTADRNVRHVTCREADHLHTDLDEAEECGGEEQITTVCKLCAEPVEPAYVTEAPAPQSMPGRSFWTADIFGVHLAPGSKVSLSFSEPATGRVRYFGIASVVGIGIQGHNGDITCVTKMYGDGPLSRKK